MDGCFFVGFVPESVWAKGSSSSAGLSSHLHIFTSFHLHIFSSSHLLIFTSSHLHIFSSSHLLIFTSSHLHIFLSSHLLIFIFLYSHLLIFTSSHLRIFTSCPFALLPSCPFLSPSLLRRGAVPTRRHEMQPFRTKWGSIGKNWGKIAILKRPAQPFRNWGKIVTLKRPAQPFRKKWGSIVKNWAKIANLISSVAFDLEMCFVPQRHALFRHRNFQKWSTNVVLCTFWLGNVLRATMVRTFSTSQLPTSKSGPRENVVLCTFWLGNVLRAITACTFSTSQLPKVVREWHALHILTWKCASRHNGAYFFDIATSKTGPRMLCFVHFDLEMCFAPQRRTLFRHRNFQKWSENVVLCTFWLGNVLRATMARTFSTSPLPKVVRECCALYILTWKCALRHNGAHFLDIATSKSGPRMLCFVHFLLGNVLRATTACTFSTSQLPKVVREWCALYILTWKCASRHNGMHFFDIATSKSGPRMSCFAHFDLEMRFAPQWRTLFRHRNFQKWSENVVLCTFWLGNVLRATMAHTFSTSQLPKVVHECRALYILTWKRASCHNGVQFFISHLTTWHRTRRFREVTFDPLEPQIIGKTQWIVTFLPFRAPASSFFSLFLPSDLLTSFLLLSDSSHLCFSNCPYCRKFHF